MTPIDDSRPVLRPHETKADNQAETHLYGRSNSGWRLPNTASDAVFRAVFRYNTPGQPDPRREV